MSGFRSRFDPIALALLCGAGIFVVSHVLCLTQLSAADSSYALIENMLSMAVNICCTGLCLYVAWRRPEQRRLWLMWGLALLLYTMGDAVWFYIEIALRLDPFPSLADVFYLAQVPLLALGILNLPKQPLRPTEALRVALNIGVLTAAVATVMWRYAIAPVIDAGGETWPFIVSLLYPLCNFVILCLMLFHLMRPRNKTMLTESVLLFVAVIFITLADVTFSLVSAQQQSDSATPYFLSWLLANLCIGAAAFISLHQRSQTAATSTASFETKSAPLFFLFAPFLAILTVVAIPIFDARPSPLEQIGCQLGTLLVIALVMMRQVAAFADNERLNRDALTGLLNRRSLQVQLERYLGEHTRVAVYVVDLDGFKRINDTLGHNAGDLLLRSVTQRLQQVLPTSALLSRTGGDEFVIAVSLTEQSLTEQSLTKQSLTEQSLTEQSLTERLLMDLSDEASSFAARIIQSLEQPFKLSSGEFSINASIGFSLYPNHSSDSENLQRQADAAMYTAKSRGRGQIQGFTAEIKARIEQRLEIENQLRLALIGNQLELHYQPILDIRSGAVIALEALVRWDSPVLGWMMPDQFINVAEKSGLIAGLSDWVLNRACAQNAAWQRAGLPPVRIAVNLSAMQLEQPDLPRLVAAALERSGLAATWLELELVETVLASAQAARPLQELRALGVHLTIDDFGTGYSSLSYLHRLPIDALKIPQNFTRILHNDADRGIQPVLEAIIAIARSLGLRVTAEGIETPAQLELLRALGCDAGQGYLYAKPAPASVATGWLEMGRLQIAERRLELQ